MQCLDLRFAIPFHILKHPGAHAINELLCYPFARRPDVNVAGTWLLAAADYASVPQAAAAEDARLRAIDSIPYYVDSTPAAHRLRFQETRRHHAFFFARFSWVLRTRCTQHVAPWLLFGALFFCAPHAR